MKNNISIFFFLSVLMFALPAKAQHWNLLGSAAFSPGSVEGTSMAIDHNGVQYLAFSDVPNGYRATVMKFTGGTWVTVGTAGFTAYEASFIQLMIDSANYPYIVFSDQAHGGHASVMKFSGGSWNYVGTPGFSTYSEGTDAIAMDRTGNIYVACSDAPGTASAEVMKYDGVSWAMLGSGISPGEADWVSLVVDTIGVPYIAYSDYTDSERTTVKKFNGAAWVTVGAAHITDSADFNTLAIDRHGYLYLAYQDLKRNWKASVQRFDGTSWSPLGGALAFTPTSSYWMSMAIDTSDNVYIGYEDLGSYPTAWGYSASMCMRYTHGGWQQVGNTDFSGGTAWTTSVALTPWGRPYMGYEGGTSGSSASVMRLDIPGITGPNTVCAGDTIGLHNTAIWGRWLSSNPSVAMIDTGGTVSGITAGVDTVFYINYGDTVFSVITVMPAPEAGTIVGPSMVCIGSSVLLSDTAAGGVWSCTNSTATVAGGTVNGVSAGIDTIRYSVTNFCGTAVATMSISVSAFPGVIIGNDTICVGDTITFIDTVSGGVWSAANAGVSVSSAGTVTGLSPGIDTIFYTIHTSCGDTFATFSVYVRTSCQTTVTKLGTSAGLQIYPSPNAGDFTILLPSPRNEQVKFVLSDITAREVGIFSGQTNDPLHVHLRVSRVVYMLSAITEGAKIVEKVIVE